MTQPMTRQLRVQQGGAGEPVLLLLHGLGATSDVWNGLCAVLKDRWPGRWVAPDLPGHGGSASLAHYSFGHFAAALMEAVPPTERLVVLGHSLGGVLALTLASGWFGIKVDAVCGVGIKIGWTAEELARAKALSLKPNPWFATRAEAAERHLKFAGLNGLIAADAVNDAALVHGEQGWRVAFDPTAFAVGAPDMAGLLAASRAPALLAAGERDPMCPAEPLRTLQADAVILSGLGHNAHVENPAVLWPLLQRMIE